MADRLHLSLNDQDAEELRSELRKLIKEVTSIPLEGLGRFDLKVHGQLAGLLSVSSPPGNGVGLSWVRGPATNDFCVWWKCAEKRMSSVGRWRRSVRARYGGTTPPPL